MAIVPQKTLFGWREIDELGDLERLVLVLESMPDEKLVSTMENERYRGRNDYPVRAVWNSILAGIVYQHGSVAILALNFVGDGLRDAADPYEKG
jgi:hypothetical protein